MVTGAATRVFVRRLANLAVFDPHADQVGRVRDVVVTLRLNRQPPRVLGLVMEVQPRRRVFVPIGRVTSMESGAVIITGTVNLRRFEQRPGEILVLGEMLDRRVLRLDNQASVTVADVGIEQTRTRDWIVTKVAVRSGGLMRRRAELTTLDWDAVTGFSLEEQGQGAANLLAAFDQLRPADLAGVMHELSAKRRAEVAAALDDERLADVLEELPEDDQVEIMNKLEDDRAADVLEAMAPDDAADLLAEMPTADAERLLTLMEPDEAAPVRRLLTYSDDTAGGIMTSEPLILRPDATVAEALARARNPEVTPALASQIYVCRSPSETPTGRFLGIAHLQRLLREPPSSLVSGMVDTDTAPLRAETPLQELTSYLATYNLVAVPIVDDSDHLLGAVTVDDVLDHLLPDNWRDNAGDRGDLRGAR